MTPDIDSRTVEQSARPCYWQWRNLVRLSPWIRHRRRVEAPDGPGVFEAVCRSIDCLRNREKRRKKQLATYLKRFRQATAALRDAALLYLSRLDQDEGRPEPVCVADSCPRSTRRPRRWKAAWSPLRLGGRDAL